MLREQLVILRMFLKPGDFIFRISIVYASPSVIGVKLICLLFPEGSIMFMLNVVLDLYVAIFYLLHDCFK